MPQATTVLMLHVPIEVQNTSRSVARSGYTHAHSDHLSGEGLARLLLGCEALTTAARSCRVGIMEDELARDLILDKVHFRPNDVHDSLGIDKNFDTCNALANG